MIKSKIISTVFLLVFGMVAFSQVGIGTDQPNSSAALDLSSTNQGFLPPRMTRVQMMAITNPAEGLIVYCTDCVPKGLYYSNGGVFYKPSSGPVEVTSATGRVWMDRDVGARRAATSEEDYLALGHLFQWGRNSDGHEYVSWGPGGTVTESSPTLDVSLSGVSNITSFSDMNTIAGSFAMGVGVGFSWANFPEQDLFWQNGFNDPCPNGFSVPSTSEWNEEMDAWVTKDKAGAFASPLKISSPSILRSSGNGSVTYNASGDKVYWARDNVSSASPGNRAGLAAISNDPQVTNVFEYSIFGRAWGFPVRCIKNTAEQNSSPSSVISSTGKIWLDRNLGASRVAQSRNDSQAYGDLYQWGRLQDGHESTTSGVTSTLVSNPSYAAHSDFVTNSDVNGSWTSYGQISGLWQAGLNDPCPIGFRVPTQTEFQDEVNLFSSQDTEGAYQSVLKLPVAGFRSPSNANLINGGTSGHYWTSTYEGANAINFSITPSAGVFPLGIATARGSSVRCIYDADAVPAVVGLNGAVWMDRDLGASRVAQSADDFEAYGYLYQWGRDDNHKLVNYTDALTGTGISSTSSTQATTQEATDSRFIVGFNDWTTFDPDGSVLWQNGENDNNPCPSGFRVPTQTEFEDEVFLFSSQDLAGAFNSPLRLTQGGFRWGDPTAGNSAGNIVQTNSGFYWTSNAGTGSAIRVRIKPSVAEGGISTDIVPRSEGMSVRCIKN